MACHHCVLFGSATQHTHSYPPCFSSYDCFSVQILTAQFRQMEQELAEAIKLKEEERQQWVEQASRTDAELTALRNSLDALERERTEAARQEAELSSLREAEHVRLEALEKEKTEVVRLEKELALTKEAELAAVQACHDASERDRAEIARLERELASMREAESAASQDAAEREKTQVHKLETELDSLRQEYEDSQKKGEMLTEVWRHLRSLALEDVQPSEESPAPTDFPQLLETLQSIETQLTRLKDERSESEERRVELNHTMGTLQGESIYLIYYQPFFHCLIINIVITISSLLFRTIRQKNC